MCRDVTTRDVKSCQIRHPDARIRYPGTSGCSHRICKTIFVSYMSEYVILLHQIVLIMKDDGIADENVGWTRLQSTPEQSERFKFDVHISSIIASYMSRIMTKTVFMVSDKIRTNGAVHCIAVIRKVNGLKIKGIRLSMLQTNVLTSYTETT